MNKIEKTLRRKFTDADVAEYYDTTEVHYRMFWRFEQTLSLHYGVWTKGIRNLAEAMLNTNLMLARLGGINKDSYVLDAGCGCGGSSICLADNIGCKVTGITLSAKQVSTAANEAKKRGVGHLVSFQQMNYTATAFPDNAFDFVWAIESMQTAPDKSAFLKEASRVLKPGGKLLIADCFKSYRYNIEDEINVAIMFNGWAVEDIVTPDNFTELAQDAQLALVLEKDLTKEVNPTVHRILFYGILGMFGTFLYNSFVKKASYFSRIHYRTAISQYLAYKKNLWKYEMFVFEKKPS